MGIVTFRVLPVNSTLDLEAGASECCAHHLQLEPQQPPAFGSRGNCAVHHYHSLPGTVESCGFIEDLVQHCASVRVAAHELCRRVTQPHERKRWTPHGQNHMPDASGPKTHRNLISIGCTICIYYKCVTNRDSLFLRKVWKIHSIITVVADWITTIQILLQDRYYSDHQTPTDIMPIANIPKIQIWVRPPNSWHHASC